MKKKCANSGFFSDTKMNHGAVIAKKSSSPETRCSRFQIDPSRDSSVYSTSTAPGKTMPIKPLDNTASAMPAQQASTQFRCSFGCAPARCASSSPHSASVIMADNPMSNVFTCDIAAQKKLDASTTAAE